ncbi:MAG TPA: M56 family metallopeptidase [Ruminiclostridium sp.]
MLENIFTTVLNMSITASIAAIVIILVRTILHKSLPKLFSYAIWGVVLVRLLIPFSFSSMLSIFNILPTPQTLIDNAQNVGAITYIPSQIGMMKTPKVDVGSMIIDNAINNSLPAATPTASVNPMQIIMLIIAILWLAGTIALMIYNIYSYRKAVNSLKTATLLKDDMLLKECRESLKMNRKVELFTSDSIDTPVVCGMMKPRIIIPKIILELDTEDTKRYILLHELVHIRRCDYLLNPLSVIALCLHWFNPIVWLSLKLSRKDMEMACDEKVMSVCAKDIRNEYATSLIAMAAKQNGLINSGLLAFGESNIKSRVKGIMGYKKPVFFIGIVVAAVLVITSVVLLTNPAKTKEVFANTVTTNTDMTNTETINTGKNDTTGKLPILMEQPFKLSEAKFNLGNKPMTLKLIMTKGTHVTAGEIGPYGTDYYEGNLIGEVYDSQDKLVSTTDMTKFFTESIIFRDKFNILFDDYNGDGYTDFTVGQYASSNYNTFNIFTIRDNSEISLLPVKNQPDGVMCSNLIEYYSTKFLKTQNNGIIVTIYNMEQGNNNEATYQWQEKEFINITDRTELVKPINTKITLKDGSTINSNDLIEKLDKTSDETISYVYNKSPNNIKVGNIYEGSFSNSGKNELIVIFKFLMVPHAGGSDLSLAAIYDRNTLNLVSQKSFAYDECQFEVVKDANDLAYLLFSGTTTYQGHSTGTLQVFDLSKKWEQLLPQENSIYSSEDKYKFELLPNGVVSVLVPEFSDTIIAGWNKKSYLKWNKKTSKLEDFVPSK